MTTSGGQAPPARVQLTAGSWVGIVGIAATLMIAFFAASDRANDRFDRVNDRFDERFDRMNDRFDERFDRMNDRMAAGHQEIRAEIAALGALLADVATRLDGRMDNLAVEMGHVRGQLDVMRGQLDVPAAPGGRGMQ